MIIRLLNQELYTGWSGFFLFAIIGACVSTANSQLLLIASSFSYDVVRTAAPDRFQSSACLRWTFGGFWRRNYLYADGP